MCVTSTNAQQTQSYNSPWLFSLTEVSGTFERDFN